MKKKILLAGGGGYIGSLLTQKLLDRDYDITVADLLWFGNHLPVDKIDLWKKNIMDIKSDELVGFDAVVFMAGLSNDPMADFNPAMNFIENTAVPAYLAYISKKAGVNRFIYAGSCSVYGYSAEKLMYEDSEASLSPEYPYGISKLAGERVILDLEDNEFKPIILRKGTVGGWSPRMRYDLVVNAMTKTALTKGKIVVHNPSLWRPIIDINDVCTAYVRSIESNPFLSGVYNICYDNYTIGRLAEEIREELKDHGFEIELEILNRQDVRNYKACNTKAKVELDFVPSTPPRQSVKNILENIGDNFDFSDKKYYNIKVFKELK